MDKVKPLKIESVASGGSSDDDFPTEVNPNEDYVSAKGIAFENLDEFTIAKIGRVIVQRIPSVYEVITYDNLLPTKATFYNSNSYTDANRIAEINLSFDTNLNLTSEVLSVFDINGTSLLRTYTRLYNYSGFDLISSSLVVT